MALSYTSCIRSQTQVPEPVTGSGKFYYPDGATYEGEWLLIPEPESTGDEATAEDDAAAEEGSAPAAAETEEAAPSSEETPDENDVAAETGDEQAAEPKGTYFRHGRGKYIEGEYSYDGEWEHVRNTSRTRIACHERPSHNTIS